MEKDNCTVEFNRLESSTDTLQAVELDHQNSVDASIREPSKRSFFSKKSFLLTKSSLIVIAIILVLIIGLSIAVCNLIRRNTNGHYEFLLNKTDACLPPSCESEVSRIINSMDWNVDPCKDFYSFTCGNSMENDSPPDSHFMKIKKIVMQRVKDILEDLVKQTNLPANKQKATDFYKQCVNEDDENFATIAELLSDLKKLSGWPVIEDDWKAMDFDWAVLMARSPSYGYLCTSLFNIRVGTLENASVSTILINLPDLVIGEFVYKMQVDNTQRFMSTYKEILYDMAKLLKPNINREKAKADIEKAVELEIKIAKISTKDKNFLHGSLDYFDDKYKYIPLAKILQNILPPDTKLTGKTEVTILCPSMFEELNKLLKEFQTDSGKRVLANYMFYRMVFQTAGFLNRKSYMLLGRLSQLTSKNSPNQDSDFCAEATMSAFALPVISSYVQRYMNNGIKELTTTMLEDVRSLMTDAIKNAKWVNEESKNSGIKMVKNMEVVMVHKDEIMDDSKLDEYYESVSINGNYFGNVKKINAFFMKENLKGLNEKGLRYKWSDLNELLLMDNIYYMYHANVLTIPLGVLNYLTSAVGTPNYINYGKLGWIISHEVYHAFDHYGDFLLNDDVTLKWMAKRGFNIFEAKCICYMKKYGSHVPEADYSSYGALTLGENIADNGAVQIAYYAYKSLLQRINSKQSLPVVPYDEKQMFWISFASVMCQQATVESTKDVRIPPRFRVIGSISNMREFSDDFHCKLNTTMHPSTKCPFFEF